MVKEKTNDNEQETLITIPHNVLQKFVEDAYQRGKRDAYKEIMRSKTHKTADIGSMAYKANIVFDDEEKEDERKS